MKFLFLHQAFPAQFYEICRTLGADSHHQVVFLCHHKERKPIPGVRCLTIPRPPLPKGVHPYAFSLHNAATTGVEFFKAADALKRQGFYPDIIVGHSGWGYNLYMKELFPKAKLIAYCEWFFHAHGREVDFDPSIPLTDDLLCLTRTANASFLLDLDSCDAAISPTSWQKMQFPKPYQYKIAMIHDGIDTELLCPSPETKLILPKHNLDLTDCPEIITYVSRGKDLHRGFPQFMEMVRLILEHRPQCHVVIVGGDQVAYGPPPQGYKTYKDMVCSQLKLDWSRVHFTGPLEKAEYIKVLQASSVHVYLTYPFVLSWSLLEALSVGCLVLASDTAPVQEVIQNGVNGFLTDFFSPGLLAQKVNAILERQSELLPIRQQARQSVVQRYDRNRMVPLLLNFYQEVREGKFPVYQ